MHHLTCGINFLLHSVLEQAMVVSVRWWMRLIVAHVDMIHDILMMI